MLKEVVKNLFDNFIINILDPKSKAPIPVPPAQSGMTHFWQAWNPNNNLSNIPAPDSAINQFIETINGLVSSQPTPSLQPIFKTNVFRSQPSIRFDGADDWLRHTQFNLASTHTIILGAKPRTNSGDGMPLASNTNTGGKDQLQRFSFSPGNPSDPLGTFYMWNGPPTAYAQAIPKTNDSFISISRQTSTTSVNARFNGVQLATQSRSNSTVQFGQIGALGGLGPQGGPTPGGNFDGDIAFIVIFNRALSDVECQAWETFFNTYFK